MTIHFAAATSRTGSRLHPAEARSLRRHAANDNGEEAGQEAILHAALRQFARHGIGAAAHARQQAEHAFFAGDRETYRWWLGVCRTLDKRMAANLAVETGAKPSDSSGKRW